MTATYFLDTNILVYATSLAADHASRRDAARTWVARNDWGISTQVLMELFAQARQARHGLPPGSAHALVEKLATHRPVVAMDAELVMQSLSLAQQYLLSHWDAAILCAARKIGAHTVISEDLAAGQDYGGVTVLNPFTGLA